MELKYGLKSGLFRSVPTYDQPQFSTNDFLNEIENTNIDQTNSDINFDKGAAKVKDGFNRDLRNELQFSKEFLSEIENMKANQANSDMNTNKSIDSSKLDVLKERKRAIESEIANLEVELAYKSKLRTLQSDPQWKVAAQQYINTGDSSGINAVMSTLNANAQAELNRKITEDQLKQSKIETLLARLDEAKNDYQKAKLDRDQAFDVWKSETNPANERVLGIAELTLEQATNRVNKIGNSLSELDKNLGEDEVKYERKTKAENSNHNDKDGSTPIISENNPYKSDYPGAISAANDMLKDGYFAKHDDKKLDEDKVKIDFILEMATAEGDEPYKRKAADIIKKIEARRTKIAEEKAKSAALESEIKAVVKSYGKGRAGKDARNKAYSALSNDVKNAVVMGYDKDTKEYIIKRK